MRRTRGFTLIEIMVALALAGLVVAGAIQLHVAFNRQAGRQQAISEMQQSLRVAMQILERAIRTAGQGLPATHTITGFNSSCTSTTYYDFQFSNSNTYTDPPASYWNPATKDNDPDWFRVIASDTVGDYGTSLDSAVAGGQVKFYSDMPQSWLTGDLFVIIPDTTVSPNWSTATLNCLVPYQVTGTSYSGTPTHAAPGIVNIGVASCYNQVAHNNCIGTLAGAPGILVAGGTPSPNATPSLRHIAGGFGTVYRIMPPSEQGTSAQLTPKLTMRSAPFGTTLTGAPWTVLADNIEDMQIAVILTNGIVCTSQDNPLVNCDFTQAVAVRVTLVARSTTPIPGAPPSPQGGYEDEPVQPLPTPPDYLLRRSMTATIVLRNLSQ
jgi:prepilin-type N-terminal cleavage/methylation domain-containing protein